MALSRLHLRPSSICETRRVRDPSVPGLHHFPAVSRCVTRETGPEAPDRGSEKRDANESAGRKEGAAGGRSVSANLAHPTADRRRQGFAPCDPIAPGLPGHLP